MCVCNIKAYTAGQTQSGEAAAQLGLRRLMSGLVCVILVDYTHIYTHSYFVAKYISPFYSSIHFNFLVSECHFLDIYANTPENLSVFMNTHKQFL